MNLLPKIITLSLFFLLASFGITLAQTKNSAPSPLHPALDGKILYTQICLGCHQEDGGGVPSMNPPLIGTSYVLGDKTELISIILKGLSGKVKINGKTYSNIMASQAYLKDDQIAAILTYVRSSFGNSASAIKPEEVKAVRSKL